MTSAFVWYHASSTSSWLENTCKRHTNALKLAIMLASDIAQQDSRLQKTRDLMQSLVSEGTAISDGHKGLFVWGYTSVVCPAAPPSLGKCFSSCRGLTSQSVWFVNQGQRVNPGPEPRPARRFHLENKRPNASQWSLIRWPLEQRRQWLLEQRRRWLLEQRRRWPVEQLPARHTSAPFQIICLPQQDVDYLL